MNKRDFLKILGGGVVVAATPGCSLIQPQPDSALAPWQSAGSAYSEPRRRALSYAILCPNPHNRQPWQVDLSVENEVTLFVDTNRLLPHTDPYARQITIGLGCFLELMVIAASVDGYRVDVQTFPAGSDPSQPLDARPVARATFHRDSSIEPDELFAHVLNRRSNKEAFDLSRPVPAAVLEDLMPAVRHGSKPGSSVADEHVAELRQLTKEALLIEIDTPRTYKESVDLFRIGRNEVNANPDGIDFTGRSFELLSLTGLFTRSKALDTSSTSFKQGRAQVSETVGTAMGHVWLTTTGNTRLDQLSAGRDWLRLHLAITPTGVALHPISQALQEYPEMATHYAAVHRKLAPAGGTVQMLGRVGFGQAIPPSPRWPLAAKIRSA